MIYTSSLVVVARQCSTSIVNLMKTLLRSGNQGGTATNLIAGLRLYWRRIRRLRRKGVRYLCRLQTTTCHSPQGQACAKYHTTYRRNIARRLIRYPFFHSYKTIVTWPFQQIRISKVSLLPKLVATSVEEIIRYSLDRTNC